MTGIIPATKAHRPADGGKALDHGRARDRNLSLFEHDDREGRKSFEQLTPGEAGNRDCAACRSFRCRS
jgi:hypothetical protein